MWKGSRGGQNTRESMDKLDMYWCLGVQLLCRLFNNELKTEDAIGMEKKHIGANVYEGRRYTIM